MIRVNNDWEFSETWTAEFARFEAPAQPVRLPHSVRELPLHYADPADYEMLCGYRRRLFIPEEYRGKRLFLQFDGAAHIATVYVNGQPAAQHSCGYTAFRAEFTAAARFGEENEITVRLDCTENPGIPPFGFVIDYLTYGGLYRDVWLDVRPADCIEDIFVTTPDTCRAHIEVRVDGSADSIRVRILNEEDSCVYELCGAGRAFDLTLQDARPWSPEDPCLYRCEVSLLREGGRIGDVQSVRFGFRTAEFRADGFYLNGRKLFLRGLNRHQSYPYMGYAAPESLQREDARILKEELACTAVRTSHYPQSRYFIEECDRLGLLVFTEIPGWQHIGDEAWKDQAVENTREMILQYRNHPSIVLWGVRINESQDDDDLYARTNALAHELDPSRQTGGVRCFEKSHLLEDVYTYNDFSHTGGNRGVRDKKDVMNEPDKPLMVTEHSGHMFPAKSFDPWSLRQEQALRHARVQGAACRSGEHCGCFGWCMFDYQTHRDFGSGDRICYHGVLDAFRNPKTAAALYASQGEDRPVLEVSSPMDIGDYPAGDRGDIYIFTNADSVDLYKNDRFVTSFVPKPLTGLPHEPILMDDYIGGLLESEEGFGPRKARRLKACLSAAGKYGLAGMPLGYKAKMGWCMLRYQMKFRDGYALYGKYVSCWGDRSTVWRFDAKKDGAVAASVTKSPSRQLRLELQASSLRLKEGDCYDCAAVRIRILDENGSVASFAQAPLHFTAEGPLSLIGPADAAAEGGMSGTYVKTTGEKGPARLRVSSPLTAPAVLDFVIE